MSRYRTAVVSIGLLLMQPFGAHAQDFEDWMLEAALLRSQALEAIDLYLKRTVLSGVQLALPGGGVGPCVGMTCQAVKIETVEFPDGSVRRYERPLSPMELGVLTGNTSSAFLRAFGRGMLDAQFALNGALGAGPQNMDEFGAVVPSNDDGELFLPEEADVVGMLLNPTLMFGLGGAMVFEAAPAAAAAEQSVRDSADIAQTEANQMFDVFRQVEFAGNENVGNTPAAVYEAPTLALPPQQVDAQEFTLTNAKMWIDPENYRFLKQRMEGTAVADGQSREIFIEIEFSDFRNPPSCGTLEEPFRRVMRMGGMLDQAQMAEMEEARVQLAEFEQQLASMSAREREMMERMLGSQMDMMRGLVSTGAIEYVEQTEDILCNPDLASLFSVGGAPPEEDDEELVRQIQEYLVILGYEPGNIDGVLDDLTRVAISQFQAEQGVPVTGEASVQLATMLAAAIGL